MQRVRCITTFLHSINATRGWNENGRFSARLGLAKLMSGREIDNVVFLRNTEIFEERKHKAFLPFNRGLLISKSRAKSIFEVLPDYV